VLDQDGLKFEVKRGILARRMRGTNPRARLANFRKTVNNFDDKLESYYYRRSEYRHCVRFFDARKINWSW